MTTGRRKDNDDATEIEVSEEMIEAGLRVLWDSGAVENPMDADRTLIREIFAVMRGLQQSAS